MMALDPRVMIRVKEEPPASGRLPSRPQPEVPMRNEVWMAILIGLGFVVIAAFVGLSDIAWRLWG